MRDISGLSSSYLYIDGRSIPRKNSTRSIYKYYTIVYVKRKEDCNDLSSMTVSVTVRLLKKNCCQVLQSIKEISVFV